MISISAPDGLVPPRLKEAVESLNGENRRRVYSVAGEHMANIVRKHLLKVAPSNHKTALSFTPAATPTGHLEKAARNTIFVANEAGALVVTNSPGITRAFHALHIRAKRKMLTIPARTAPEAYGKTASQVGLVEKLFLVKTKSGGAFLATGDESKRTLSGRGRRPKPPKPNRPNRPHRPPPLAMNTGVSGVRPVFWLRAAVTVPQKRDIYPSDETIAIESAAGIARGVRAAFKAKGVSPK